MRILITGAAGMLGRDVEAVARREAHQSVALARAELDIRDARAVLEAVAQVRPDVVINCAAWTDVDAAETEYRAALAVNGDAAEHVATAAAAVGAWVIHISTDYVFDGTQTRPYVESDPPSPVSGYGRSKLAGERAVACAAGAAHTIVRTSWLFGINGHSFPKTILGLARERDQLRVVDDQVGCPTYTGHLAVALVSLAAAQRRPRGILHAAAAGQCSWYELAQEIVATSGASCQLSPCTTEEFPRPAPRPAYSVMRSERGSDGPQLPHWRDGLREFMAGFEVPA